MAQLSAASLRDSTAVSAGRRLLFPSLFIVLYLLALGVAGIHAPCWTDEGHFYRTVQFFESRFFSLATLAHYHEISTPLPFMLYALWGMAIGGSLFSLRIFSLIIAGATLFAYHHLYSLVFRKRWAALLATVFLACNPYFAGTSIFVYTDMSMMLCLALFMIAVIRGNRSLLFLAGTLGLLCRQYFAFVTVAGCLYYAGSWLVAGRKGARADLALLAASMLPLFSLFLLWHGVSPVKDNGYVQLKFHLNSAVLYITLIPVYALPLLIVFRKRLFPAGRYLAFFLIPAALYWFCPVDRSEMGYAAGIFTVGYFHRLVYLWPGVKWEHVVFFLLFSVSITVCLQMGLELVRRVRKREFSLPLLLILTIFSFIVVMPVSYLHWEKYFLPLVPVLILYAAVAGREEGDRSQETGVRRKNPDSPGNSGWVKTPPGYKL